MNKVYRTLRSLAIAALLMSLSGCESTTPPDIQQLFVNLAGSYPNIFRLITSSFYVMGFYFAYKAVFYLRQVGENRLMAATHMSMKTPLAYFLISAVFLFTPSTLKTILLTTFGDPNVMPLTYAGTLPGWSYQATDAILGLVQIVGLVSFFRGWIYMARAGEQSAQPGNFGKGLTHIIGGILAVNIVATKDILMNTLGLGS